LAPRSRRVSTSSTIFSPVASEHLMGVARRKALFLPSVRSVARQRRLQPERAARAVSPEAFELLLGPQRALVRISLRPADAEQRRTEAPRAKGHRPSWEHQFEANLERPASFVSAARTSRPRSAV